MDDYLETLALLDAAGTFTVERPVLRDFQDPFQLPGNAFQRRYRFTKAAVLHHLLPMIKAEIEYITAKNCAASPLEQLLVFLRFAATDAFHMLSGDLSTITLRHESSVSRYVHRVANAFARKSGKYIFMPKSQEEVALQCQFHRAAGFPGVTGLIDGVQIPIANPGGENAELYRNRKNVFSLNVQVVCDPNLLIRDIVCKWFGLIHDARIFDNSSLKLRFDSGELTGILLGDAGYPAKTYLLTPFLQPSDPGEERYNKSHKSTRITVERCFGVWKRKFPVLHYGLRFRPERTATCITALAVLHNIARGLGECEIDDELVGLELENDGTSGTLPSGGPAAMAVRRAIVSNHFRQWYVNIFHNF